MNRLKTDVLKMASFVSQNLKDTFLLLFDGKPFKINDDVIDEMEKDITDSVISIIIRERPYAHDLRLLISTLRIVSDLERIGDLSVNLFHLYEGEKYTKKEFIISEHLMNNLNDVLNALITENVSLAKDIISRDDLFDRWYDEMFCRFKDDNCHLSEMLIVKDIERIADHITNIAEWVVFIYDGEIFSEVKRR